MSPAEDPIRETLIEARRNQILDAASNVFAQKGFHRATTRAIATAAGVSEGTIYNYFASKADLLLSLMARLGEWEHLDAELDSALKSDVQGFFVAVFSQRIGRIEHNQEMLQAILPEILVNPELRTRFYQQFVQPITALLESYVQTRIKLGDIRAINVPLTVRAVQSMFVGLLILRIIGDESLQSGWDDLPNTLATLIFDGLNPGEDR